MKTVVTTVLRWLVLASLLAAPGLEAANISFKAAAGRPFNLALDPFANLLTGTVTVIGTQDLGGGLDGVVIRCQLHDGATQLSSQVGSSIPASVPVGSQQDVPVSCTYSQAQSATLSTVPGSFLFVTVEQGGNPGQLIASSGAFIISQSPPPTARFVLPTVVILGVTKQGSSFVVDARYSVQVVGVTSPPYTAEFGWFSTGSPPGSSIPLGSLSLSEISAGPDSALYSATFTATFDTASAPGLAGAVGLYVSLPGAPTVNANASFPTALACNASAVPQIATPGQNVTLTASCQNSVGPLQVEWKDGNGTVIGTGAILNFVPTGTGSKQYTATVTDQVSTRISQQGIKLTTAPVSVTVAAATPPPTAISNQSGNPPPSNPGSRVALAVKVVDAQGSPVSNAQLTSEVTGGNGTLTLLTPQPADGIYRYDFLLGSDTSTRTVKICLANNPSTCTAFTVRTIATAIIVPAQQLIGPLAAMAISTPAIQIDNIRQHLDQARFRRYPAVTQGLKVSFDGQALPPLESFALAPAAKADKRSTGGAAGADAIKGGGAAADNPADPFARWGGFISGDIDIGKQSAVDTQTGFKLTSKGLTLGADYRFEGEHMLGAALGLLKADSNVHGGLGTADAKGYSVSLFGTYVPTEKAYIDLIANIGHNTYDSQRQQSVGGNASSNTSGNQFAIAVSAGWNFNQGPLTLNPFGRVEYVDAKVNGFTESGNPGEALTIGEQRVKATTLTLGGQASYAASTSWGVLLPYARLELQYLAQTNAQDVTAQLVGVTAPAAIVPVLGQDKTFGNFAVGASAILPRGVSCFFNYQQVFGKDNFKDQKYTLGLRLEF